MCEGTGDRNLVLCAETWEGGGWGQPRPTCSGPERLVESSSPRSEREHAGKCPCRESQRPPEKGQQNLQKAETRLIPDPKIPLKREEAPAQS